MKNKLFLTFALVLGFASVASADAYIRGVVANDFLPRLIQGGYRINDTVETGLLRNGQTMTFTIYAPRGQRVRLMAVGDIDSYDVDLFVRGGETGRMITCDTRVTDRPDVTFVSQGGSYEVTVRLYDSRLPSNVLLIYAVRG